MTQVKIRGWSRAYDVNDIEFYVTLTRFQDPSANSNKYRRFITMVPKSNPHEQPLWFTHTGRWVTECTYNSWNDIGTYRETRRISSSSWARHGRDHLKLHKSLVQQKLSGYTVVAAEQARHFLWAHANTKIWVEKSHMGPQKHPVIESYGGTATPVAAAAPTTQTAPRPVTPTAPTATSGSTRIVDPNTLPTELQTIGALVEGFVAGIDDPAYDVFSGFAEVSNLKVKLKTWESVYHSRMGMVQAYLEAVDKANASLLDKL